MTRDYKDSCVNETKASAYWIVVGIVAIIALLGVMGERDREHQEEVAHLVATISSMETVECAPAMEMSMPIDVGVQL
jgi:hypothetical protein